MEAKLFPNASSSRLQGERGQGDSHFDIVYAGASKVSPAVLFTIYSLIVFLSLVGNNIVIYVVIRCRSMWSITNFFIANLATSDVLMSMFAALFTPIAYYTDEWLLPHFLCRLLPFTMGVSVHVSTLTSTAIAVDRYLVIVHPFFPKMQRWMCFSIIAAIWCFSVLICLPLAIFQHIQMESKQNNTVCAENWPSIEARKIFSVSSFVFQFVIPCVVISFCYFHVSRLLWIRRNHKIGSGLRSVQKEEAENRRHRKTNTMLIAMVVVFVVCWIPLNALWIIVDELGNEVVPNFEVVFLACHFTAMCSAVSNPLLYAFLNENFRKNIGAAFSSCFLKRSAVGLSTPMVQDQKTIVNLAKHSVSNNEESVGGAEKSGIINLNDLND